MYDWRSMSQRERKEAMACRKAEQRPWHAPPHYAGEGAYHVSAACYEHSPVIGASPERMADFERELLDALQGASNEVYAWCVLPNHYHVLVDTPEFKAVSAAIGQLHGRLSFLWNGQDKSRGRKVWHRSTDRRIRSERHFWVTMNYVHHNPVHHGYVKRWEDWPFSSARDFLQATGRAEAIRLWKAYPILDYGKGWDDANT